MKRWVLVAVAIVLGLTQTRAQPLSSATEAKLVLRDLQMAAEALPPADRLPRLQAAIDWLARRADRIDSSISVEYVRSLHRAAQLLRTRPDRVLIEDVASELETKVEHCRVLGVGMGGSVLVRVSTRRGADTVQHWQVFYLLKIYERIKGASPAAFPTLSTPTEVRLDPGRYWMWARDPVTGRTGDRTLVRVAGQTELPIDLPVP